MHGHSQSCRSHGVSVLINMDIADSFACQCFLSQDMHKLTRLVLTTSIVLLSQFAKAAAPSPVASQFAGPYLGFKLGVNTSNASGNIYKSSHTTVFPGFTAGYNFDVNRFVVGAEIFADLHHGSVTFKDAGIDAKIGMPFNQWMPYARVGFTGDEPDTRLHWGLGIEYKFSKRVSAVGEWTTDSSNCDGTKRKNNSVTIGVQYHFN